MKLLSHRKTMHGCGSWVGVARAKEGVARYSSSWERDKGLQKFCRWQGKERWGVPAHSHHLVVLCYRRQVQIKENKVVLPTAGSGHLACPAWGQLWMHEFKGSGQPTPASVRFAFPKWKWLKTGRILRESIKHTGLVLTLLFQVPKYEHWAGLTPVLKK